jgi:hypothetical protein
MSLWYKLPEDITYNDIDAFCTQQLPEGLRLDYKLDIPKDLAKLVAAFANTQGGLIIFGVEADKTANKPVWPSKKGMAKTNGIDERITAICRDNIYPPVRPQISSVIDNPNPAGTVLTVVRIDESREAPHAVDGLVYERTGSQVSPYRHSQVNKIAYLLRRRNRIEQERLAISRKELKRASRQIADIRITLAANAGLIPTSTASNYPSGLPIRWASVIPAYPWRDLCTPQQCFDSLALFQRNSSQLVWQKVPGGAFGRKQLVTGINTPVADAMCCSMSTKGHVFAIECANEVCIRADMRRQQNQKPATVPVIDFEATTDFASRLFEVASLFYTSNDVELPGYVILATGLIGVRGCQMAIKSGTSNGRIGKPFLDDDYEHDDLSMPVAELIASPGTTAAPLFDALKFGFDL